jgi:PKD domain
VFDRIVQSSFRTALASLAGLLLICGSATAAPTWLEPTSLSATGESATNAQVAVDARGDSVAVWQRTDAMTANTNDVQAAVRQAGGNWQATPTTLASCFFFPTTPEIAVDPSGDAVAVWECASSSTGDRVIEAATATGPALQWSKPVQLSNSFDINVEDPQVAIDASGDATVIWVTLGSGATSFVQVVQRPAGGAWSTPVPISRTDTTVGAPQVAEDPSGDATAVWTIDNDPKIVAEASMRPAGAASWGMPMDLSDATAASNAEVAMSPQGAAIAVWQNGTGTSSTIQAAAHSAGGQWGTPLDIPGQDESGEDPQVAIDPRGDATAVWDGSNGTNAIVQAAQLPAGASAWQAAENVSDAGQNATAAQIAADAQGDLVAVWQRSNGTNTIVQGAARPVGGSWQPAKNVSAAGENTENPEVAVDSAGNASAAWDRSNGTNTIAQGAGYDAAPLLTTVAIPATATAGKPVTFSASALGVWSPVTGTTWNFGDGQTASGAAVTHTYATAGTYKVTVTSTDGLSNPTTDTGTITVAPGAATTHPATAPTLTHVSQTHERWREGSKAATIARKHKPKRPPIGTAISFTVDETARVTLTFTQTTAGRKFKRKCQAPTRHNLKRPACKRTVTRGTLAYTTTFGRHTVAFDGRIAGHELPLGVYSLRLTATGPTGQRSRTASLRFTIAK